MKPEKFHNTALSKWREQLYDTTPVLGRKIRHDAVNALEQDASPEAIAALAEALIRSPDSKLQMAAMKALLTLVAQGGIEAQEALCRLVIEHDHPFARQVVLAAQYVPQDLEQRVLLYFLTEQWDEYETADPDQRILTSLYRVSSEDIQRRIASCIRRSKRLDWIPVIPGERSRRRAGDMSDSDWEAALRVIVQQGDWPTLWHLTFAAPVSWSVRFLLWLRDVQWQSERPEIQEALPGCIRLAEYCHAQDETPSPYGVISFHKALKRGGTEGITCLAMSSDNAFLAGGTEDGVITVWSLAPPSILHQMESHRGYVMSLALNAGNSVLLSSHEVGVVMRWNLADGSHIKTTEIVSEGIECSAFSPDGVLFAAGTKGTRSVWNLSNEDDQPVLEVQREAEVESLAFAPDASLLAEGWDDGMVRIRHLPEGRVVHSLQGHDTGVISLSFSPDGQLLASGSDVCPLSDIFYDDPGIQLWRVADGRALKRLKQHVGAIEALAFSPDGRLLVSSGGFDDNTVNLWRLPEGSSGQTLQDILCPVTSFAFSPDGKFFATGSVEGTARLWDAALTDLRCLRIGQTQPQTFELLQERLQKGDMTRSEQTWLTCILALSGWLAENRELLPECVQVGEADIELHT